MAGQRSCAKFLFPSSIYSVSQSEQEKPRIHLSQLEGSRKPTLETMTMARRSRVRSLASRGTALGSP